MDFTNLDPVISIRAKEVLFEIRSILSHYRASLYKANDGAKHWAVLNDYSSSPVVLRGIIGIPTVGCVFARTHWGGCSICGHVASTLWNSKIDYKEIIADVRKSLSALSRYKPPVICLYTSGSFLDHQELPHEVMMEILNEVKKRSWVRKIIIESLPQFIKKDVLLRITNVCPNISFSIGIGVDSCNEFIRYFCFLRHIPNYHYVEALSTCYEMGFQTIAYIVHKPPFLSTKESIFDTAESIVNSLRMGFSSISIEPIAIQAGTLQELLFSLNQYKPPTIFTVRSSIAHSLEHVDKKELSKRLILGGQVFTPLPYRTLNACNNCLDKVHKQLPFLSNFFEAVPRKNHSSGCGLNESLIAMPINPFAVIKSAQDIINAVKTKCGEELICCQN